MNLVPRAVAALNQAAKDTGDTKTDTVNRALQVYAKVTAWLAEGCDVAVIHPNGDVQKLIML
ncbi:MAG TPA: hypothetical protein VIV56_01855 [Gemmatimonadales bacterium]